MRSNFYIEIYKKKIEIFFSKNICLKFCNSKHPKVVQIQVCSCNLTRVEWGRTTLRVKCLHRKKQNILLKSSKNHLAKKAVTCVEES